VYEYSLPQQMDIINITKYVILAIQLHTALIRMEFPAYFLEKLRNSGNKPSPCFSPL